MGSAPRGGSVTQKGSSQGSSAQANHRGVYKEFSAGRWRQGGIPGKLKVFRVNIIVAFRMLDVYCIVI